MHPPSDHGCMHGQLSSLELLSIQKGRSKPAWSIPFVIQSSLINTHNEEIVDRELGRDLFGRNAHATQCHCLGPSGAQQDPA